MPVNRFLYCVGRGLANQGLGEIARVVAVAAVDPTGVSAVAAANLIGRITADIVPDYRAEGTQDDLTADILAAAQLEFRQAGRQAEPDVGRPAQPGRDGRALPPLNSGVVHRDLKPSNILEAADGTLKVADFGIGAVSAKRLLDGGRAGTLSGAVLNAVAFSPDGRVLATAGDDTTAPL